MRTARPWPDGFEVLRSVERLGLRVPIIVYTGTGDYDRCAQAIRLGAYSFIDKAEPMERVAQEVENAIERRRLSAESHVAAARVRARIAARRRESRAREAQRGDRARGPVPSPVLW